MLLHKSASLMLRCCFPPLLLAIALFTGHAYGQPTEIRAGDVVIKGKRETAVQNQAKPENEITGDTLRNRVGATLGETLTDTMGVSNSSYGPGVGVPVIRGLSGSRVRTLVDGIGTHDGSVISPDHAVAADPATADRIRIIRGPAAIRYGGAAIGGAVDVQDERIPEVMPRNNFAGRAELRYGNNGSERLNALKLSGGANGFALNVGAFTRSRENMAIPGLAIDEAAIAEQFGLVNQKNSRGHVPNTDLRAHGANVGGAWIGSRGMIGLSAATLENNYGIPPGAHSAHSPPVPGAPPPAAGPGLHTGDDRVRIDMRQTRYDLKGHLDQILPGIDRLALRSGYIDYGHDEVDGGRVSTRFSNRALESRLELTHGGSSRWTGMIGAQHLNRKFSAIGDEAFVPQTDINGLGAFAVQRLGFGPLTLEAGARVENQDQSPKPFRTSLGNTIVRPQRDHTARSYSASATWQFAERTSATLIAQSAQRMPDVQELYSFGPHLATRTFNVGNDQLITETLNGVDIGFQTQTNALAVKVNAFRYNAEDYIFQRTTGLFYETELRRQQFACVSLDRCLPVVRYEQKDAKLQGYEIEAVWRIRNLMPGTIDLTYFGDYVRAEFRDGTDVPRQPPRRHGIEIGYFLNEWSARLRYTRAAEQHRPGENEVQTKGYNLLNFNLDYRLIESERRDFVLFFTARNLLNEEIRSSTSFLRSFAPEPGRRFEIGLRANF